MDEITNNTVIEDEDPMLAYAQEEEEENTTTEEPQEEVEEADVTLTEEQEQQLYDRLEEENPTTEIEEDEEEELTLEEADFDPNDPGLNIDPTEQDYKTTFAEHNISEEEANTLYGLIMAFKGGEKKDFYEPLPAELKKLADALRSMSLQQGHPISKNEAAKFVIKDIMSDAQFNAAFSQLQEDLDQVQREMDTEYGKIFTEAYQEIFDQIDEIEAKDPEQAEKIRKVKKVFDDAYDFNRVITYIKGININKLRKKADNRYGDEVYYFNKKVNVTDVKIPDANDLDTIIMRWLPQYNIDQIRRAVVAILNQCDDLDVEHDMIDLVYVYRLINNIYSYRFIEAGADSEATSEFFGNLSTVIDTIIERLAEK